MLAALALLSVSCEKPADHTGDMTGDLYGRWILDTKTVVSRLSGTPTTTETSFAGDNFILYLYEPRLAFAQEGTLLTFDIDDVDAGTFSFNADQRKITFDKTLRLVKGFLTDKTMTLSGTFDVVELTQNALVIRQEDITSTTTTYAYHKVATE